MCRSSFYALTSVSLAALMAVSSATRAMQPAAQISLEPRQQWEVGTVDAHGAPYCAMVGKFDKSSTLAFARSPEGFGSLGIEFAEDLFKSGASYEVSLTSEGLAPRTFSGEASTARSLIVQIGEDEALYKALGTSKTLRVVTSAVDARFVIGAFDAHYKKLETCSAQLGEPPERIELPPDTVAQAAPAGQMPLLAPIRNLFQKKKAAPAGDAERVAAAVEPPRYLESDIVWHGDSVAPKTVAAREAVAGDTTTAVAAADDVNLPAPKPATAARKHLASASAAPLQVAAVAGGAGMAARQMEAAQAARLTHGREAAETEKKAAIAALKETPATAVEGPAVVAAPVSHVEVQEVVEIAHRRDVREVKDTAPVVADVVAEAPAPAQEAAAPVVLAQAAPEKKAAAVAAEAEKTAEKSKEAKGITGAQEKEAALASVAREEMLKESAPEEVATPEAPAPTIVAAQEPAAEDVAGEASAQETPAPVLAAAAAPAGPEVAPVSDEASVGQKDIAEDISTAEATRPSLQKEEKGAPVQVADAGPQAQVISEAEREAAFREAERAIRQLYEAQAAADARKKSAQESRRLVAAAAPRGMPAPEPRQADPAAIHMAAERLAAVAPAAGERRPVPVAMDEAPEQEIEVNRAEAFLENIMRHHVPKGTTGRPAVKPVAVPESVTPAPAVSAPVQAAPQPSQPSVPVVRTLPVTQQPLEAVAKPAEAPVRAPVMRNLPPQSASSAPAREVTLETLLEQAGVRGAVFRPQQPGAVGGEMSRQWTVGRLNGMYEQMPAQSASFEVLVQDYIDRYRQDCPQHLSVQLGRGEYTPAGMVAGGALSCKMPGNAYETSMVFVSSGAQFAALLHSGNPSDAALVKSVGDNIFYALSSSAGISPLPPAAVRPFAAAPTSAAAGAPGRSAGPRLSAPAPAPKLSPAPVFGEAPPRLRFNIPDTPPQQHEFETIVIE